jgi:hypothetical protein
LAAAPLEPSWRARAAPYPDSLSIEKRKANSKCADARRESETALRRPIAMARAEGADCLNDRAATD